MRSACSRRSSRSTNVTSSVAAPAVRSWPNELHFFGAFERTDQEEFYTVNTGLPQFYGCARGHVPASVVAQPVCRCAAIGRSATRRTCSAVTSARTRRRRARDAAAPARPAVTRESRAGRSSSDKLDSRSARAQRLPIPVCVRGFLRLSRRDASPGRRPDSFRRTPEPIDAAVLVSVVLLRQQLRLHQPGEPLGIQGHLLAELLAPHASRSAASTTTTRTCRKTR